MTALNLANYQNTRVRLAIVSLVLGLAVLAVLPFVFPTYRTAFLILTFMYITLASSWNIVSGYTGYVSFGHVAFFGKDTAAGQHSCRTLKQALRYVA